MRDVYLVAYDIACPKRYRKIYKSMCGHGNPLQYSVFRCELTKMELQHLKSLVWPILNLDHDRVMIVDLGPIEGRGDDCIEFWGEPKVAAQPRTATIL